MTLPDEFVEIMYAYYQAGHSLKETGEKFNRTAQGVRSLFHRRQKPMREPYKQIKTPPLEQVDRAVIEVLEQIALELRPGDFCVYPYGINYATLNNIRARVADNNRSGVYDDKRTFDQCNVYISQEHTDDKYYIVMRKVKA